MTEYRICWNASSNINFRGSTDWEVWEEDYDLEDFIYQSESGNRVNMQVGLAMALEASGFDWYLETRES